MLKGWAAVALGRSGVQSPQLIDPLIVALVGEDYYMSQAASEAFSGLKIETAELVARLVPHLGRGKGQLSWNPMVANVLIHAGAGSPEVVAALVGLLRTPLDAYAVQSLGALIGRVGTPAIAALAKLSETGEGEERLRAIGRWRGPGRRRNRPLRS